MATALLLGVASPSGSGAEKVAAAPETNPAAVLQTWTPAQVGMSEKARLTKDGRAIPPVGAPKRVRAVIAAANRIRNAPYGMGGGHAKFRSKAYDCSGAVSFALHGGGLLRKPIASSSQFDDFGKAGPGSWITVYGMGSHAYAMIAGLRWDTAGTGESGPSWHRGKRSEQPGPYFARHPAGL